GCQFPLNRARRIFRHVARLSFAEMAATLIAVALGVWLLGQTWEIAILLGILALATAPATTILVLKEVESEGPITEYTQALVAINNLVAIIAFEIVFLLVELAHAAQGATVGPRLLELFQDLAGSCALGVTAGLLVSYCFGLLGQKRRLSFLVAISLMLLGLCNTLGTSYMFAFLAMGVVTANTCFYSKQILAEFDRLTGLLCVVFFAASGAELDIGALMSVGVIGVGYIVLRCVGKYFGIFLAAGQKHERPVVRRWLGVCLVPQAGAAIALAAIAFQRDPALGRYLQTIIIGTVPFFEIIGPILIRQAVLRGSEVPLAYAVPHAGADLLDQLGTIWNRIVLVFGYDPWRRYSSADLTVHHIMRKNIHPMLDSLTFDEVLALIEHSRENSFPVVSAEGEVVGMIRYRELSQALVDRTLGPLVRAADLATGMSKVLYPDDPIQQASKLFGTSKDDCLPVVEREAPHKLLGIVRRRDMLRLLIRRQPTDNGISG
ncbi:MAG: CBS domain-containing protein, partial [Thermoguttaceae bacterium]